MGYVQIRLELKMKATYMLWYLSGKTWRLISEGTDKDELVRDIPDPMVKFSHRGYEYRISEDQILMCKVIHCITSIKGF